MRNLIRLTYAANKQAALEDWRNQVLRAYRMFPPERHAEAVAIVAKHDFRRNAGIRTIDERMAALRSELDALERGA